MREAKMNLRNGVAFDAKQSLMLRQVAEGSPGKLRAFQRVYEGRASPRQAIKAACLECAWLDEAAIGECRTTACPLWGHRPYVKSKSSGAARVIQAS